ncbi:MAG: hypothetical protein SWE60_12325 [Thermodesulfobacteriota bacterium]|nr:hypothetical protein [Thermodesulfobacteriota bacterium]
MTVSACRRVFVLVALCLLFSARAYGVEEKKDENGFFKDLVNVKLDLFHSDTEGDINPKLGLTIGPKEWETHERELCIGSGYLIWGFEGEVVQVWDDKLDQEPSFLQGNAGLLWKLAEVEEADGLPPLPGEVQKSSFKYNYGGIRLKAHAQAETDDDADNVNLVGGAELVYSSLGAFKDPVIPLPSFGVTYEYVGPTETEARDRLGADTSSFSRMRAFVLWSWDFGGKLAGSVPFVKHLGLQAHYRFAKEYDQPEVWKAARYDEYDQASAKLRYLFPHGKRETLGLREIYAGFSSGRQLAHAEDDDRILLGVLIQ